VRRRRFLAALAALPFVPKLAKAIDAETVPPVTQVRQKVMIDRGRTEAGHVWVPEFTDIRQAVEYLGEEQVLKSINRWTTVGFQQRARRYYHYLREG